MLPLARSLKDCPAEIRKEMGLFTCGRTIAASVTEEGYFGVRCLTAWGLVVTAAIMSSTATGPLAYNLGFSLIGGGGDPLALRPVFLRDRGPSSPPGVTAQGKSQSIIETQSSIGGSVMGYIELPLGGQPVPLPICVFVDAGLDFIIEREVDNTVLRGWLMGVEFYSERARDYILARMP